MDISQLTHWVIPGSLIYTLGFATPYVLGLRKQNIQHLQAANWKTGDLLKLTFWSSELGQDAASKLTSSPNDQGEQISEMLMKVLKSDTEAADLVAELSRMTDRLVDGGLTEVQAKRFIDGSLSYLPRNIVTYRAIGMRLAGCILCGQLLQRLQLPMYAYCWTFGDSDQDCSRAFDIARTIESSKSKWALIPYEKLELIMTNINQAQGPLSTELASSLPGELDDICANPDIEEDLMSMWNQIKTDFLRLYDKLDGHYSSEQGSD